MDNPQWDHASGNIWDASNIPEERLVELRKTATHFMIFSQDRTEAVKGIADEVGDDPKEIFVTVMLYELGLAAMAKKAEKILRKIGLSKEESEDEQSIIVEDKLGPKDYPSKRPSFIKDDVKFEAGETDAG
jgi:HD-like signal output (HDOD) protein